VSTIRSHASRPCAWRPLASRPLARRPAASRPAVALLAACALAALLAAAPARASSSCTTLKPRSKSAPYLIAPCDRATVPQHRAITFIVYDSNPLTRRSTRDRPYLDLATSRRVSDGQLSASTNGTGVFEQLSPRPGHRHEWILTVRPQVYRTWWDNYAGARYVQIRQLDPAAPSGVIDSPIVTLNVARTRR
jgi:hypothetical protein